MPVDAKVLKGLTPGCRNALRHARPIDEFGRRALPATTSGPVIGKLRRLGMVEPDSRTLTDAGHEAGMHHAPRRFRTPLV